MAYFPIISLPSISPIILTSFSKNSIFFTHSSDTIHVSLSTETFLYITFGLTHKLVTPKIVSGLNVVTGKINSPNLNLTRKFLSSIFGSTSPIVSCCDTGF